MRSRAMQVQLLEILKVPNSKRGSCIRESTIKRSGTTSEHGTMAYKAHLQLQLFCQLNMLDNADKRCQYLIASWFCD